MAQFVVFLAAQQDAGKDVVNFSAVFICGPITTSAKKSGLRSKSTCSAQSSAGSNSSAPPRSSNCGLKRMTSAGSRLSTASSKNIVGLFERFVFGQAIVQIHFHDDYLLNIVGHVLQQRAKEVKQSFGNSLPQRTFRPQSGVQQA